MCQVWTVVPGVDGCVRCRLNVSGVHWMWCGLLCQVWTGKVRCELNATDLDCMCQVWTGSVRCGLDM